jgi:hypothetical protein
VGRASTVTALLSSSLSPQVHHSVTFTATVAAKAPGAGLPTGTVTFLIDGKAAKTVTLVGGTASFTTSSLTVGTHKVSVTYNSDSHFFASTSAVVTESVQAIPTSINAFLSSLGNIQIGVPFAITVQALAGSSIVGNYNGATASISIVSGPSGATLGGTTTVTFKNGQAVFSNLTVPVTGTYTLSITTSDGLSTQISVVTGGRQV